MTGVRISQVVKYKLFIAKAYRLFLQGLLNEQYILGRGIVYKIKLVLILYPVESCCLNVNDVFGLTWEPYEVLNDDISNSVFYDKYSKYLLRRILEFSKGKKNIKI